MDPRVPPWRSLEAPPIVDDSTADEPLPRAVSGPIVIGALAILSVAIAAAVVVWSMSASGVGEPALVTGPTDDDSTVATVLVVEVEGAVSRPGVYRLAEGSRVADAIAAAGGYSPRVDVASAERDINLASVLHDGDRVAVPSRDSSTAGQGGPATGTGSGGGAVDGGSPGLVSLNGADQAALEALPGIGPVTATKIIAARQEQSFRTVDELLERKVVGKATFERIRGLVTVEG
jgi:competence protein ComEA